MKFSSARLLAVAAVACAGTVSAPTAFAQSTFTPGSGTTTNCNTNGLTVDSKVCSDGGSINVTMTAWGFTGNTLGSTALSGFQAGRMGDFDNSGIGAYTGTNESGTGANHAFDNVTSGCGTGSGATTAAGSGTNALSTANSGCGGGIEALLLNFGSTKVNLTNVGIGFNGGNADLSVWAWTGSGDVNMSASTQKATGSTTTTGTTAASLTGWTLVSNHDFGGGTGTQNTLGTLYSSYFLITTYFGAATSTLTAGNDQFKLNSFTVGVCGAGKSLTGGTSGTTGTSGAGNGATCTPNAPGVPEPGSLALVGFALMGAYGIRRRKGASA